LIYEESGMNFVLLLCIQLLFTWTHQITIWTLKSADHFFINVYIIKVANTVSYDSPHHFW